MRTGCQKVHVQKRLFWISCQQITGCSCYQDLTISSLTTCFWRKDVMLDMTWKNKPKKKGKTQVCLPQNLAFPELHFSWYIRGCCAASFTFSVFHVAFPLGILGCLDFASGCLLICFPYLLICFPWNLSQIIHLTGRGYWQCNIIWEKACNSVLSINWIRFTVCRFSPPNTTQTRHTFKERQGTN